jgi:hypothetical protein
MRGKEKCSGTILNYDTQFSLKCNLNKSRNNDNSLFVLFQQFQQLIFNIFKMKILLKEKCFLLFKKDLHHGGESKENQ